MSCDLVRAALQLGPEKTGPSHSRKSIEPDPAEYLLVCARDAYEGDYRAGQLSLREIGSLHGFTEGAIRKRAKRDDWTRDLEAKVRAKAEDLVRKQAVRKTVRNEAKVTERVLRRLPT